MYIYLPLSLLIIKYKTDILFLSSGFPFFVSVTSTSTGRFFPTNVGLCSHDFVKNVAGKSPKYRMGDGAKEITNAGKEVFKDLGVRLMCWPHTYKQYKCEQSSMFNKSGRPCAGRQSLG